MTDPKDTPAMNKNKTTMTGASILWECLEREGVKHVFGYPGGAILPAYDALKHSKIHHVLVRHEQGATHMADGYARASGQVGVAVATSGPGATNMVTGIATAMLDSSPIVCITGQVGSKLIGSDAFQETDITGVTLPITKHNYLVTHASEVARTIREAFYVARSGRPGPVLVDITKDAQQSTCEFDWEAAKPQLPGYRPDLSPAPEEYKQALDLAAGRSSMLRLVIAQPDPDTGTVKILGVDDFAFRRGRDYGTVLVDVETGRPVDLLRDREAGDARGMAESTSRDRGDLPGPGLGLRRRRPAGRPGRGAGRGQLDHHNLCEHVEKAAAGTGCLEEPAPGPEPQEPGADDQAAPDLQQTAAAAAAKRAEESALAVRTRQRYEQVQALKARGKGIKPIMRETGLAKETVRRFYRAGAVGELLAKVKDGRPSVLDEHKPYLHQRWNEGCTNVRQLHAELKQRGYKGGYGTIRDYVLPFRQAWFRLHPEPLPHSRRCAPGPNPPRAGRRSCRPRICPSGSPR